MIITPQSSALITKEIPSNRDGNTHFVAGVGKHRFQVSSVVLVGTPAPFDVICYWQTHILTDAAVIKHWSPDSKAFSSVSVAVVSRQSTYLLLWLADTHLTCCCCWQKLISPVAVVRRHLCQLRLWLAEINLTCCYGWQALISPVAVAGKCSGTSQLPLPP